MRYNVVIAISARKDIKRLDGTAQGRINKAIASLADNPRPPGCRKMVGSISLWRIRVGDYRVVYNVEHDIITVHVIKVGHRKDIYR